MILLSFIPTWQFLKVGEEKNELLVIYFLLFWCVCFYAILYKKNIFMVENGLAN